MNVLVLSTNPKIASHLHYGKIVTELIYLIGRKGSDEINKVGNITIEFVGYRNTFQKYRNLFIRAARYIEQGKVSLVSADQPFSGLLIGYLLRKKFNIPLNVQMFAAVLENGYRNNFKICMASLAMKILLKKADSIRAMCIRHKEMLIKNAKLDSSKIYVCPPCYDIENFIKMEERLPREEFKAYSNIILFVGRLENQKDLPTLLRSISLIKRENPKILCLIIGRGSKLHKLQKLAKLLDVDKNIIFLGQIPNYELPKYYNSSDIFVLSSLKESLGVVMVEAAACKKPIVSTRTIGAQELVIDGFNGYIVNIKDYKEFAEKIKILLNDSVLRKTMGENNYQHLSRLGYLEANQNLLKVKHMWEETLKASNNFN